MRNFSLTLEQVATVNGCYDKGVIFDFDYEFPQEYKCRIEELFMLRYKFYCINYDSVQMFKHMLESKFKELVPKYFRMYASEKIISNPFINHALESDSIARVRARNKTYQTNNNRAVETNDIKEGGYNVDRRYNTTLSDQNQLSTTENNEKNKAIGDDRGLKYNRYSDSPQTQHTSVDESGNPIDRFNDGYITTITRDDSRNKNLSSSNRDGFERTGTEITNNTTDQSTAMGDHESESESVKRVGSYSDYYDVGALENTQKQIAQIYGLKGVTVSQILEEWRRTFIKIDEMFLDELRGLFLYNL